MNGFVWNAKKPNEPQAVPREPRNSQIDRKSSDTTRPVDSVADRPTAWLGPSWHVKGDLTGREDLVIDGAIEGMLRVNYHKLTEGRGGKVSAERNAREGVDS